LGQVKEEEGSSKLDREAYGVDETARLLNTSDWTIKKLLASGELDSFLIRGRRLIPREAIAALIARGVAENAERRAKSA
jgi:excisionase family DNA binding protein